jgi:hypothetical protein
VKELWANLKKMKGAQALFLLLCVCVFGCLLLGNGQNAQDTRTDAEARAESVLSAIRGAGEVRVVIYSEKVMESLGQSAEKPVGAVVVAQGAGDPGVRIRLLSAAQTLFALPAGSIEVFEMGDVE